MSSKHSEKLKAFFDMLKNAFKDTTTFIIKFNKPILASILVAVSVFSIVYFGVTVKRFNIIEGDKTRTITLLGGDSNSAFKKLNLNSEYKIVSEKQNGNTIDITVKKLFPVTVVCGKNTLVVNTTKSTVREILKCAGLDFGEEDMVEPSIDTVIKKKSTVKYFDVEYVNGSYNEAIPFDTETVYANNRVRGDNTHISGVNGEQKVYYTQKRINGEVVETLINNTEIVMTSKNAKNIIGTAVPRANGVITSDQLKTISTLAPAIPITLDANGVPVNYKKVMTVQATGYTYTGHNCSTGVAPQPGYIAVNPNVIPYGTKMYIKSTDGRFIYGYAVAADTGGFIHSRPTNVDLFFSTQSACKNFGRRNVEIYILE